MGANGDEALRFTLNASNAAGARKLVKLLHSTGVDNCRVRKTVLEVFSPRKPPMDMALHVASLASFAFEKDVVYGRLKDSFGRNGFFLEIR